MTTTERSQNPHDWIAERLREALESVRPTISIEHLLAEVSLYTTAADMFSAHLKRRRLPRIHWERRLRMEEVDGTLRLAPTFSGHVSRAEFDDAAAVARQWASALGLTEQSRRSGSTEWVGGVDGWGVEVWAVTDEEAWEAGLAAIRARHNGVGA